jgi:hypothetical protein
MGSTLMQSSIAQKRAGFVLGNIQIQIQELESEIEDDGDYQFDNQGQPRYNEC